MIEEATVEKVTGEKRMMEEAANEKVLLVAINAKYIHSNLAVYCLKKYAKEFQNHIEIAEYTINQYTDFILQNIYKRRPKVIAFSCYIWNIHYVTALIKDLRKVLKDVEIWVGGPEVSYRAKEFLEEYPQVNGVMVGEGEKIFLNLIKMWMKDLKQTTDVKELEDKSLQVIRGIVYRDNEGNILENPNEELLDLSEMPFPYDDLTQFQNKIIYYESSRGCPFSCSYCLSSIDKKLRFRNLELVKQELQVFLDAKIPQVKFVDRTFNCKKSHSMEIWNYILEHDNGITNFHFEVSADLIDDEELELFQKMRPGLIQLEIGVQTTNETTIQEIHRTMKLERLKYVVDKINSFGNIHQHLDLIAGLPYEGLESFKKSFDDVYAMKPEQLQLGFLKVLNGAYMHMMAKNYELLYTDAPPYEVLSTKWLSYDEILSLKKVENVVEIYYNSRQFVNSIQYLEKKFESPFKMYEALGNYFEIQKLDEVKHSRIRMYEILLEFAQNTFEEDEVFLELLKLDVYLRENIKSRPKFASQDEDEKLELRAFYKEYKNISKNIHIERFGIDVVEWMKRQEIVKRKQFILFDYRTMNPVNHQCRVEELEKIHK